MEGPPEPAEDSQNKKISLKVALDGLLGTVKQPALEVDPASGVEEKPAQIEQPTRSYSSSPPGLQELISDYAKIKPDPPASSHYTQLPDRLPPPPVSPILIQLTNHFLQDLIKRLT